MTTIGHGVLSQYNPNAQKEWQLREARRQERSSSPEKKAFNPADSFYSPSIVPAPQPTPLGPLEQLHAAMPRSLAQLRQLQKPGHLKSSATDSSRIDAAAGAQPRTVILPKLTQHVAGGIPPGHKPTNAQPLRGHYYHMGACQSYNQKVHSKASLITTRRP